MPCTRRDGSGSSTPAALEESTRLGIKQGAVAVTFAAVAAEASGRRRTKRAEKDHERLSGSTHASPSSKFCA